VTKFKPGDVVRFTKEALNVPVGGWSKEQRSETKDTFVRPTDGEFVVANVGDRARSSVTLHNGQTWSDGYLDLVRFGDFSNVEMYLVGGAVRDRLMGNKTFHDLDFTVVAYSFAQMRAYLIHQWGVETFVEQEEYGTVRGRFGRISTGVENSRIDRWFADYRLGNLAGDFVLSRKEGYYTDGRHPDDTTPGTLYDDLARRDFTMNAIALDEAGLYVDPFVGQGDIDDQLIRGVGDPKERFAEDALRAVRALRFFVTKGFDMHEDVVDAMEDEGVLENLRTKISTDRVRDELDKCFRHDVGETLSALGDFPALADVIFSKKDGHGIGLKPTTERGY
jgi:tRNA nucleotidyltransferase/poly(A) polymerase